MQLFKFTLTPFIVSSLGILIGGETKPTPVAINPAILAARHALYLQARELNPARWSGNTRNWSPIGAVTLNPERDCIIKAHLTGNHTQPLAA